MQTSVQKTTYAYDSQGRLVSRIDSGASNDVVSSHVLLDPRVPGPKHITNILTDQPDQVAFKGATVNTPRTPLMSTIVPPTQQGNVLNSPHLYSDPISRSSPPTNRTRSVQSTMEDLINPFNADSGGISSSTPILDRNLMSSTSFQIDQAKKLAELVEAGEIEKAQALAGNVKKSAEEYQKHEDSSSQSEILKHIDKDATIGGLNRENIKVVDTNRGVDPIHRREIAPIVGEHQEHSLKQQFLPATERAQEQTQVKESQMTTAERETQVPTTAGGLHDQDAINAKVAGDKNQTTAAKETKVPKEQAKAEEKKQDVASASKDDKQETSAAAKAAQTGKPVGQDKSAIPGASKADTKVEQSEKPVKVADKTEKSDKASSSKTTETKTEKSDSGDVTKVTTVKKEQK